ncbi:hypothetical protein [Conexibacter sp. CPCC 206217]|uniref:hypothetical protein n=1 Tax=Conexibacter sp. CPCC 206217 TaxID=3064574 RepID=UPI002721E7F4|nr:hypothetical protein [Conexibacter sp. CPCC 206217]MDO8212119.1 hypothetical protein [Conexibacter sp. CPCC 206217]
MPTQTTTSIRPQAQSATDLLATIWQLVQDGRCVFDDVAGKPIAGIEHYADLLDLERPLLLSELARGGAQLAPAPHDDFEAAVRALAAQTPLAIDADDTAGRGAGRTRERAIKATGLIAQHAHEALAQRRPAAVRPRSSRSRSTRARRAA